jgi:hypothetical protein
MDLSAGTNPFTLENGLQQLKAFFSHIELKRYNDSLRITEIEPLMAYICSSTSAAGVSESALAVVRTELDQELQSNGEIFVTKDSGLFVAVK